MIILEPTNPKPVYYDIEVDKLSRANWLNYNELVIENDYSYHVISLNPFKIRVYNYNSRGQSHTLPNLGLIALPVDFSLVEIKDIKTNKTLSTIKKETLAQEKNLIMSPQGTIIIIMHTYNQRTIKFWDTQTAKKIGSVNLRTQLLDLYWFDEKTCLLCDQLNNFTSVDFTDYFNTKKYLLEQCILKEAMLLYAIELKNFNQKIRNNLSLRLNRHMGEILNIIIEKNPLLKDLLLEHISYYPSVIDN